MSFVNRPNGFRDVTSNRRPQRRYRVGSAKYLCRVGATGQPWVAVGVVDPSEVYVNRDRTIPKRTHKRSSRGSQCAQVPMRSDSPGYREYRARPPLAPLRAGNYASRPWPSSTFTTRR